MKTLNILLGIIAALLLWCALSLQHIATRTVSAADFAKVQDNQEQAAQLRGSIPVARVHGNVIVDEVQRTVPVEIQR